MKNDIKNEIQRSATQAQYGVVPIPFHKHTGNDSPKISYNSLTDLPTSSQTSYGGYIEANGTVGGGFPLPTGWTSVKNSTGDYTITHNLNTGDYVVTAICANGGAVIAVGPSGRTANSVTFVTYTLTGVQVDQPFMFILLTT